MESRAIRTILNFLLPESYVEKQIVDLDVDSLLSKLNVRNIEKVSFASTLFSYRDPDIRNLIWALKYHGQKNVSKMFSIYLYEHILSELGENAYLSNFYSPILIPIPLSKKRLRERGYNQAEIIARDILSHDGSKLFSLIENVLIKINNSNHQAHTSSKKEREANIINSFKAVNRDLIEGRNILLIDDVITTGATVIEARKILLDAGAKNVRALSIAH